MTERERESERRIESGGIDAATAAHGGVLIATADESLLDLIDNLLNRGVMLHGEFVLGVADVDLIYARLSLLLCAADRVLPPRETR